MDIAIPPLTANGHGYFKPIDLLEQLPSYTLFASIRQRIDCVMGYHLAIVPINSKKLTQYLRQRLNEKQHACMHAWLHSLQMFYF